MKYRRIWASTTWEVIVWEYHGNGNTMERQSGRVKKVNVREPGFIDYEIVLRYNIFL